MILKKLYNDYGLNIEPILIKYYKELNLTMNELNVILVMLNSKSKRKTFSISSISRKSDFNQNEVAGIMESLINKQVLEISLETTNKVSREIYSLDKLFLNLTNILNDELSLEIREKNKTLISNTITLFEEKLNRMLRPNELERIRLWYDQYNFNHEDIINAINSTDKNLNVLYIEKILNIGLPAKEEIDEETNNLLDQIYKEL